MDSQEKYCPSCQANRAGEQFCGVCGSKTIDPPTSPAPASVPPPPVPEAVSAPACPACGELCEGVKFCSKCGTAIPETPAAKEGGSVFSKLKSGVGSSLDAIKDPEKRGNLLNSAKDGSKNVAKHATKAAKSAGKLLDKLYDKIPK